MAEKQFPHPKEVTDKDPVAWRSREDLVDIANQANGWTYKNFSQTVQEWILGHALSIGWDAVYFPFEYPNKSLRAGAVFVKKPLTKPTGSLQE